MSVNVLSDMIGVTMKSIDGAPGLSELVFHAEDGRLFRFYHEQDCCENVQVEDVCGELADLIGSPIVEAEEVSNEDAPVLEGRESYTWTFYRFASPKGTVTVRWLGESNGYYGEGVSFEVTPSPNEAVAEGEKR